MHIDLDVDVWICMHLKACKTDKLQMIVIGTRQHDWETFCQFLIRFSSVNGGFFWSAHFVFIEQIDPWNLNSASAQHQHSSRTMSHLKMVWRQIAHHLDLQLGGAQRISINSIGDTVGHFSICPEIRNVLDCQCFTRVNRLNVSYHWIGYLFYGLENFKP